MARNGRRKERGEEIVSAEEDDSDFGTSDGDPRHFEALEQPVEMELGADIYEALEYIPLDWPSRCVEIVSGQDCRKEADLSKIKVLVGTCPAEREELGQGSVSPRLVEIDLGGSRGLREIGKASFRRKSVCEEINRIHSVGEKIYTVGDTCVNLYSRDLEKKASVKGDFGYGICATGSSVLCGTKGFLGMYSLGLEKSLGTIDCRAEEIHAICLYDENTACVAGKGVWLVDLRSGDKKLLFSSEQFDVNATGTNGGPIVLSGDDAGEVRLTDVRGGDQEHVEKIRFHRSPISHVEFCGPEIFGSSSDCEVCLWDTSFTEEWEYHKYLSFVHQGQNFYKQFRFIDEHTVVTTSLDGLCIFRPVEEMDGAAKTP
jgi:hypothetical protein